MIPHPLFFYSQEIDRYKKNLVFSWYDKSKKSNHVEKDAEAIITIRQFYAFIINGVSLSLLLINQTYMTGENYVHVLCYMLDV